MILNIAPGLKLPLALVTETVGIVARRGAGKTHCGVCLAEEFLKAGVQIVVLDPLGVWWGLRSSKDGRSKGFRVVVFGGDHGDVPLTESMGAQVADVIVQRNLSAVIDLATMSKSAARRFATAFAERLYEAKQPESKRTPLHLFVDESDLFMPQRVQPDQARMLGAFEMFPRRGRVRGFGVTAITQRPATLNKDILTQIEVLITLQVTGPQDRKAVLEWVEAHDDGNHRDEFIKSLAGLTKGEAWVWSPSLLNIFQRVQIRDRETFDSSRTPTAGHKVAAPKEVAEVDLVALRDDLKQVIEEQERNDPAKLKKRVQELEKELKKATAPRIIEAGEPEKAANQRQRQIATIIKSWLKDRRVDLRASMLEAVDKHWEMMDETLWDRIASIHAMTPEMIAAGPEAMGFGAGPSGRAAGKLAFWREGASAVDVPREADPRPIYRNSQKMPYKSGDPAGGGPLGKGERAILVALAQAGRQRTIECVGITAGYVPGGGTFKNYVGSLRTRGYITGRNDALQITETGAEALGSWDPLPTGPALVEHWVAKLGKGQAAILRALVNAYPDALTYDQIGEAAGYESGGGTFKNYIGELRTRRLAEGRREVKASAELMGDA